MAPLPARVPLFARSTPNRRRNQAVQLTSLLALLAFTPLASAAYYGVMTSTEAQDEPFHTDVQSGDAPVTATSVSSYDTAISSTGSQAYSSAGTGSVHLTAAAIATVNTPSQPTATYSQSEAGGGFSDQFVLQGPGMTSGMSGTAVVALHVTGSLAFAGPAVLDWQGWSTYSKWEANLELGGASVWSGWHSQFIDPWNTFIDGTANFGTVLVSVPVVFGAPTQVGLSGRVEARAGANTWAYGAAFFSASSDALLGNTIAWGGIVNLYDANGTALSGYSAFSADTGFDYANAYVDAVPEPASYAMMLAGLGLVGWVARHRRF